MINYFKETGKGRKSMCDLVENYAKEYAKESKVQLLYDLITSGDLTKKRAVEQSGLTADEFDAIVANLSLAND